jgi:hypothetical protein
MHGHMHMDGSVYEQLTALMVLNIEPLFGWIPRVGVLLYSVCYRSTNLKLYLAVAS